MEYNPSSGISHLINLVYDDTSSTADTILFHLRHNTYGDTTRTRIGNAAASFPIGTLVSTEKTHVIVKYPWYDRHGKRQNFIIEGDYYTPVGNQEENAEDSVATTEGEGVNIH